MSVHADDFDDILEFYEAIMLAGSVELECGCVVEPDGYCDHGNESPLLEDGLI